MFDAALEGLGRFQQYAYFFVGNSYITFDWTREGGRVSDGYPRPLSDWNLPAPFDEGVHAALAGAGAYTGTAYFFKGSEYVAYNWADNTVSSPAPLTAWNLPTAYLGGFDAAWSGEGSRAGKAYFLFGNEYLRYDWATNRIDANYPKPFAERRVAGMPGHVNACLNGRQQFAGRVLFFAENDYAGLRWSTLLGDSPRQPVYRNLVGLAEMAAVVRARQQALVWVNRARSVLAGRGAAWPPSNTTVRQALPTHFHIGNAATASSYLPTVRTRLDQIRNRLIDLSAVLRYRTIAESVQDQAPESAAYTWGGGTINVTQSFLVLPQYGDPPHPQVTGPNCHAAMIQHEAGHQIGMTEDYAYEHDNAAYAALPVDQAVENTSSYVAFGQHVTVGSDMRWGHGPRVAE